MKVGISPLFALYFIITDMYKINILSVIFVLVLAENVVMNTETFQAATEPV